MDSAVWRHPALAGAVTAFLGSSTTAIFSTMTLLYGPRPVHLKARRVCMPKPLAERLQLCAGTHARIGLSPWRRGELLVEPWQESIADLGRRDPDRPRLITAHGQISLPVSLLAQVGLGGAHHLVYFALEERVAALRVIPVHMARLRLARGEIHV
jgi:hypothetical protein